MPAAVSDLMVSPVNGVYC